MLSCIWIWNKILIHCGILLDFLYEYFWCFISYVDSCPTSWWFLNCRGYVALKDECEWWIENDMKGSSVHRYGVWLGKASTRVSVLYLCGWDWNMEDSWPLKMRPMRCPETSVRNTTTRCVIAQKSAVLTCLLLFHGNNGYANAA